MHKKKDKMSVVKPKKEGKKHELSKAKSKATTKARRSKSKAKIKHVFDTFESGKLHSGSKKGPIVGNRKQAIAIALSEGRKAGKGK